MKCMQNWPYPMSAVSQDLDESLSYFVCVIDVNELTSIRHDSYKRFCHLTKQKTGFLKN
jgi:hypothetical protein